MDEIDFIEESDEEKSKVELTEEQKNVLDAIHRGDNILVTGVAGTGKSLLIREINDSMSVSLTAYTGVAAVNIGGITLHAWSGIPIKDKQTGKYPDAYQVANYISNSKKKTRDRIESCKRLIIDEISMVDSDTLDLLDGVFRLIRNKKDEPFGGIQMLFFGDFLQLPPVPNQDIYKKYMPVFYSFESKSWKDANVKTHLLTKVFRQQDERFVQLLNNIRVGYIDPTDMDILESCIHNPRPVDKKPVLLFSKNAVVDNKNYEELSKIDSELKVFIAKDWVDGDLDHEIQKLLYTELDKGIVPETLELKIGARVMMLRNYLNEIGIVNGSMGTVIEFTNSDEPVVEFDNGQIIEVEKQTWEITDNYVKIASRTQYPLKLAYALTIHKCQGLTLEHVECDLTDVFADSQAYVALSRAKTLQGLYLRGFNPKKIKCNINAVQFYNNLYSRKD